MWWSCQGLNICSKFGLIYSTQLLVLHKQNDYIFPCSGEGLDARQWWVTSTFSLTKCKAFSGLPTRIHALTTTKGRLGRGSCKLHRKLWSERQSLRICNSSQSQIQNQSQCNLGMGLTCNTHNFTVYTKIMFVNVKRQQIPNTGVWGEASPPQLDTYNPDTGLCKSHSSELCVQHTDLWLPCAYLAKTFSASDNCSFVKQRSNI